jgi:hypothetical protein
VLESRRHSFDLRAAESHLCGGHLPSTYGDGDLVQYVARAYAVEPEVLGNAHQRVD